MERISSGDIHFSHAVFGNPRYAADQRRIIENIQVGKPETVLPAEIHSLYARYQASAADQSEVKLPDTRVVMMHTDPSNIATIRVMKMAQRWFPKAFEILGYYQVDKTTQTAWNVNQLWKERNDSPHPASKPITVFNLPNWLNSGIILSARRCF